DALVGALVFLQELIVGALLHLDQVRHAPRFRDFAERLTNTLLTGVRQSHLLSPWAPALESEPPAIRFASAAHEPPFFVRPVLAESPQVRPTPKRRGRAALRRAQKDAR